MALAVIFACLHLVIIVICGLDNEYLVLSSSRRKWFLAAYLLGFAMLPLLRYELGSGTSDSSSFRHGTSHKEQVTNDKGQLEKSRDQTHPVSSLSPTGTGLQNHRVDASSTREAQRQILFLLACMSSGTFTINLLQLDLTNTVCDLQLFQALKGQYAGLRRWWQRLCSFKTVTCIQFVQFELHSKALVDIRK
jgi:hypothetical protein